MEGHSREEDQLVYLLNSMFAKEALRKNVYLFNALSPQLALSVRVIAKQRRIANITQNLSQLTSAIRQCPKLQLISPQEVRVLVAGDEVVVRLWSSGFRIMRKEVSELSKQMKCHIRQQKDSYLLEFQSHAAAVEFVERAKVHNKDYLCQILQKDPYKCLEEAIALHRKQKKAQKIFQQRQHFNPQLYYLQEYWSHMAATHPVFVRRAVDSDSEELEADRTKKAETGNSQAIMQGGDKWEFGVEDFPRIDDGLKDTK